MSKIYFWKILFINKHRKRRIYCTSLVVQQLFFINYNVQIENEYKKNFTYTKKNPQDQVIFK